MMKPSSADTTIQKTYDTSSSTHSSHAPNSSHGLITPVMVSSLILLFILIFVCILCSKDSFHRNNDRHSSPGFKNSFIQIFSFLSLYTFLFFRFLSLRFVNDSPITIHDSVVFQSHYSNLSSSRISFQFSFHSLLSLSFPLNFCHYSLSILDSVIFDRFDTFGTFFHRILPVYIQ